MRIDVSSARFIATAQIEDSGLYDVQCPKGHRSYTILQQQKFELLFDIGACAILDGYFREAVSSFASSLERTFEFFVWAALLATGHVASEVEEFWKSLSKHSERQLGAYALLFFQETYESPPMLTRQNVEFRNQVIHQGRIPTRQEAIDFGNEVLAIVRRVIATGRERHKNGIELMIGRHVIAARQRAVSDRALAVSHMPTIIGIGIEDKDHHLRSLEEALQKLTMWNWKL
ncbi:hypothetical protein DW352_23850 [Pseudolabrys taiwanensis]|uniref:Apea-like HEPN domain-containing protein n=1 Tax=Pseudolabrys taiwanensis TaxID=331696 RepID=A0A346A288_9HYPH|nr:hypothetical protein [Pseudolabrys taiwanensis]AXK83285.1 hypothetical protein DW352_23850 [Pseudolabrys taiwanensis]